MKRITLLLAFLVMSIGWAMAQSQVEVSGTVISAEDNQPIIGASVRGKTSKRGDRTDINGKFKFTVPAGEKVIIVSFVGMQTQEVAVGKNLRIVLRASQEQLDEVMVVAYGTAKKSTFTGSAVVVDAKRLDKMQSADAAKALEGMVPGLSVTSSSGAPGTSTTLRVRGIGSLNASSAPLIILDGAPYSGAINSINSKDIESINVLKDAASAALYGARAANGVILIQTKRGKQGSVAVNFEARVGKNYRGVPEYDVIRDPGIYYTTMWEAIKNAQIYARKPLTPEAASEFASKNLIEELGYNIYKGVADDAVVGVDGKLASNATIKYEDAHSFNDWEGLLYTPQLRQEYNLSVTKGSEKSSIFFSLGYLDDKGFNETSGFDRLTARLSYDSQVYDWLKVAASSQLSKTRMNAVADGGAVANTFNWTRTIAPIYPVYKHDAEGKFVLKNGEKLFDDGAAVKGVNGNRAYNPDRNLPAQQRLDRDETKRIYLVQNFRSDVILPWNFKFNTTATYNYRSSLNTEFKNPKIGDGAAYGGILQKNTYSYESLNWNQVLNWEKKFDQLTVQAMLGHEIFTETTRILDGEKRNLLDPALKEFSSAAKITDLTSYSRNYNIEGFFGQLTTDYAGKYYVSASLRRDASSVFAPEHRWGTFYSIGASWRIAQESFLKDIKAIDNLKLRVSYGAQGNDYLLLPTTTPLRAYTPYTNLYEIDSDGENPTFSPAFKGNREITWEKNLNFNVGLEFSFLKGLIAGEIDFFKRRTNDMLFNLPTPKATGFSSEPTNVGNMENTGYEFNLNSRVYSNDKVSVTIGVNGSGYKNKILNLPETFKKDGITRRYRIIKEGGGIYDYWMVKYAGVDPEDGDALYWMFEKGEDGKDGKFVKKKSEYYSTDPEHKQFVGSAIPKMIGGFYTNINAYGFDFSAQFSYRIGGIVNDGEYAGLMGTGTYGDNWHKDILNRWTPTNKETNVPRLHADSQGLIQTSDRFLIDGSFLSLRNVTFGYTVPEKYLKSFNIKGLRAYIVADNVALWSKRKGLDPRLSLTGDQSAAVNSAIRTVSVGLSLNL